MIVPKPLCNWWIVNIQSPLHPAFCHPNHEIMFCKLGQSCTTRERTIILFWLSFFSRCTGYEVPLQFFGCFWRISRDILFEFFARNLCIVLLSLSFFAQQTCFPRSVFFSRLCFLSLCFVTMYLGFCFLRLNISLWRSDNIVLLALQIKFVRYEGKEKKLFAKDELEF